MNLKKTFVVTVFIFLTGCSILTSCEYRSVSLPKTGQTQCYDQIGQSLPNCLNWQDGMHQAGIDWPDPRFSLTYCDHEGPCADQSNDCDDDAATDVILDSLTGLMWGRTGYTQDIHFDSALNNIRINNEEASFGICGYQDWRLPNVNEMRSAVHYGFYEETCNGAQCESPADWLNSRGFMVESDSYWTSTSRGLFVMAVSMTDGTQSSSVATYNGHRYLPVRGGSTGEPDDDFPSNVWVTGEMSCVSSDTLDVTIVDCQNTGQDGEYQVGVQWPIPRFLPQPDETVVDVLTNLYWLPDANCGDAISTSGTLTWGEAKDFIWQLNHGQLPQCDDQHDDWRLPNVIELATLFDFGQDGFQVVNSEFFESISDGPYWTSSVYGPSPRSNLVIDLQNGTIFSRDRGQTYKAHVWAVRSEDD